MGFEYLNVDIKHVNKGAGDVTKIKELLKTPETIEKTIYINNKKMEIYIVMNITTSSVKDEVDLLFCSVL